MYKRQIDFDYSTIVDFSISDFLSALKDTFIGSAQTPLEATAPILIIILLSALFHSFKETVNDSGMASVLSTVSAVTIALKMCIRDRLQHLYFPDNGIHSNSIALKLNNNFHECL